ncbi:hypothetical protein LOK49_Contig206G00003 [Camellia lanceoleosa]|nr:hypothetical protein LOK49_Contig206G00003 [Camellia lanceoleosa]
MSTANELFGQIRQMKLSTLLLDLDETEIEGNCEDEEADERFSVSEMTRHQQKNQIYVVVLGLKQSSSNFQTPLSIESSEALAVPQFVSSENGLLQNYFMGFCLVALLMNSFDLSKLHPFLPLFFPPL